MERTKLAEEIINFCITYRLFGKAERMALSKDRIKQGLEDIIFVENLIHTLILRTNRIKNINNARLKKLFLELEAVRLDLEYGE